MKKRYLIPILVLITIIYLVSINSYASLKYVNKPKPQKESNGAWDNLQFSESVEVTVNKHRWYGEIVEYHGDSQLNILYLFKVIKLPTRVNQTKFIYHHIIFLVIMLIFYKGGKNGKRKESSIENPIVSQSDTFLPPNW